MSPHLVHLDSRWDLYHEILKEDAPRLAMDIGANVGKMIQPMTEHGYKVHAFEPVPQAFSDLHRAYGPSADVHCVNLGLSDRVGVVEDVTVMASWVIGRPEDKHLEVAERFKPLPRFTLHLTTLDQYLKELGSPEVGLIKIDVDGYESQVLTGAAGTIERCRPRILIEFSCFINRLGRDPSDLIDQIADMGYAVWSLDRKLHFTTWEQVEPHWPYDSSYDVLLLPEDWNI